METRARILDATVSLVNDFGLDRVSMSAVGSRASVSRGTLYTNFETPDSIMAEKWLEDGERWLAAVAELNFSEFSDALTGAFVDVIFTAPRRLELFEVVRPTLAAAFAVARESGPGGVEIFTWRLAIGLGSVFLQSANLSVNMDLQRSVLELLRNANSASLAKNPTSGELLDDQVDIAGTLEGDDVRQQLIRAAVIVVANAGVENSSSLRICRLARLTPGALPAHFASLDELIAESFRFVFDLIIEENRREYLDSLSSPHRAQELARAIGNSLRPERTIWRKLRREMLVASRANVAVRQQVEQLLNDTDQRLHDLLVNTGFTPEIVSAFLGVNRALTLGMSGLFDCGLPVDTVNHYGLANLLATSFGPLRDPQTD
ncbi:MAG: TetR family transcriptional regulator [Acidobacteria bacterium]|nr:TetR family transcriptional regulator [Acidobacteriota bacterium]